VAGADVAQGACSGAPRLAAWRQAWNLVTSDQISLVAAGCAFYAMVALFPAISLCITFYVFGFYVATIEPQLDVLRRLLPEDSYELIAQRVHELVANSPAGPGLAALNLAQAQVEHRGVLAFYGTALLITLGAILAFTIGIGMLVALPRSLTLIGLPLRDAVPLRAASFFAASGVGGPGNRHIASLRTGAAVSRLAAALDRRADCHQPLGGRLLHLLIPCEPFRRLRHATRRAGCSHRFADLALSDGLSDPAGGRAGRGRCPLASQARPGLAYSTLNR